MSANAYSGVLMAAPIVLPLVAACIILLRGARGRSDLWMLSCASVLGIVAIDLALIARAADGSIETMLVGNWRAPFGIALVLDRLSALMLTLTGCVALASVWYARRAIAPADPFYHALFQFQLMGLNGAFLTGDLFNLFVFFEVLLIASYGLLLHGDGRRRLAASIHYVVFNLIASAIFLVAVSVLFSATGSLNIADIAVRVGSLEGSDAVLARAGALLLLVVFAVKAALLPLYFWLPDAYSAARAPVAALFAIMTKVGVYAIARVHVLAFGREAGEAAVLDEPWLASLALATLALAVVGAIAARRLRTLAANLVVASAGTLLFGVALGSERSLAATFFYLVPSTLVAAALFLLIDGICASRAGARDDDAIEGGRWARPRWGLGAFFLVFALSVAGLPPLGGFLGKAQLLVAAAPTPFAAAAWIVILASGLGMTFALARAGSAVFWKSEDAAAGAFAAAGAGRGSLGLLAAGLIAVSVFAGPLADYTAALAEQLVARRPYLDSVLAREPVRPAWNPRPGEIGK